MSEQLSQPSDPERVHGYSAWSKIFLFFGLVFVILGLLVFGGSFLRSETGPLVADDTPPPLPVKTQILKLENAFETQRIFTGIINAKRTAQLGFAIGGRLEAINAQEGESVTKGQVLALIDTRADQARLASANAQIQTALADFELAEIELKRQQRLRASGHISQQRVDNAEANIKVAQTRLSAAHSNADAVKVTIDLGRLRAPFDGIIAKRFADEGAAIAPSAPILEIIETAEAELSLGLPVRFANGLVPGETYIFEGSSGQFRAVFRASTGLIDQTDRTVKCYFDVAPSAQAFIGDVVTLRLDDAIVESGFLLPRNALTAAERGLWAVYAVVGSEDDRRVERRPVEVLYTRLETVFVRGAISEGEMIVSEGISRLVDGQRVNPIQSAIAITAQAKG